MKAYINQIQIHTRNVYTLIFSTYNQYSIIYTHTEKNIVYIVSTATLWLFNIAMENGPFIDDFPIKTSIYEGFSMAMLNNQLVIIRYRLCVHSTTFGSNVSAPHRYVPPSGAASLAAPQHWR